MRDTEFPTQQGRRPSLRELRRDRGLTVDQVAVLAGVHKETISKYERGLHQLSPWAIVKISKALKVSVKRITG